MINEEIVIDLSQGATLKEFSQLAMMGAKIKLLLMGMMGTANLSKLAIPVKVTGNPSQVASFTRTLNREKRYLQSWKKHGLDNPKTWERKADLDRSAKAFQKATGMQWPFK